MAVAGSTINEQIEVHGRGTGETAQLLVQVVGSSDGYRVAAVGPNQYQFARTFRPSWVMPLTIVTTVLLCGLGLLLLFVKRTETCMATVTEERSGVKVRLNGQLLDSKLRELRSALTTGTTPATAAVPRPDVVAAPAPPSSLAAPPPPGLVDAVPTAAFVPPVVDPAGSSVDETVKRSSLPEGAGLIAGPRLVLSTGQQIVAAPGGVIGRDPLPDGDDVAGAAVVRIDDPALSKTHLSFRAAPGGLEVRDRHSTNGTSIVVRGAPTACRPGVWEHAPVGSTLTFGDQRAEVVT